MMPEERIEDHKWVFWMEPYDDQAKGVIKYLRKTISPNYYLKVRGRGPRRDRGEEESLPLDKATRVVVYIFRKDERVKDTGLPLTPEAEERAAQRIWAEGGGSLVNGLGKLKEEDSV